MCLAKGFLTQVTETSQGTPAVHRGRGTGRNIRFQDCRVEPWGSGIHPLGDRHASPSQQFRPGCLRLLESSRPFRRHIGHLVFRPRTFWRPRSRLVSALLLGRCRWPLLDARGPTLRRSRKMVWHGWDSVSAATSAEGLTPLVAGVGGCGKAVSGAFALNALPRLEHEGLPADPLVAPARGRVLRCTTSCNLRADILPFLGRTSS